MRLVTYRTGETPAVGVLLGDMVVDLPVESMIHLLEDGDGLAWAAEMTRYLCTGRAGRPGHERYPLSDVTLLPPVLRPTKVIGAGMNFHSFVSALGEPPPAYPVLFHKTSSALVGAGGTVVVPAQTDQAVPEGELAVVIGTRATCIDARAAVQYIAGYTCANDISARDLEFRTSQWTSGKMLETFCPLGPALVTTDEVADPGDLTLRTLLNGRVIQEGNTSDMIFSVPRLVAEISSVVRLEPGDVILTGTPSDLGEEVDPVFLRHGDVVTVEIGGVGILRNPVRWARR